MRGRSQPAESSEDSEKPASIWWEAAIRRRTLLSSERIAGAVSVQELAVAGLLGSLKDLGIADIRIPCNAATWMKRSLSYRLPDKAWYGLHSQPEDVRNSIVYAMASAIHDGRVLLQSNEHLGSGLEYLLLPMELAGEGAFEHDAVTLMRYLPCFGLDDSMGSPAEYETLFAYEERSGAKNSPAFEPLMEKYRSERREFIRGFDLRSLDDLSSFVEAFGRASVLLSEKASKALQNRETAHKVACKVVRQGPSPALAQW